MAFSVSARSDTARFLNLTTNRLNHGFASAPELDPQVGVLPKPIQQLQKNVVEQEVLTSGMTIRTVIKNYEEELTAGRDVSSCD